MKPISNFKLLLRKSADNSLTSEMMYCGKLLHSELAGSHLYAQYQCSLGFLLLSSEDTLYEESLHITLLSPDFDIVDTLEMSYSYAPGAVRNLKVVEKNSLEFSFFGDDTWRLTILESPQRWSIHQLTPGVVNRWKRLLWKGSLSLKRLNLS